MPCCVRIEALNLAIFLKRRFQRTRGGVGLRQEKMVERLGSVRGGHPLENRDPLRIDPAARRLQEKPNRGIGGHGGLMGDPPHRRQGQQKTEARQCAEQALEPFLIGKRQGKPVDQQPCTREPQQRRKQPQGPGGRLRGAR